MRTVPGVVTGIVKRVDDPKRLGRVQLGFPWLNPSYRTDWAPIAAPLTGKSRGAFFMPEIEDEVLVSFEHGSFDHPFIVGFLWNGEHKPPETDLKNRVILTPGGHTLRFEDGNAKKIILRSSRGHEVVLDDSPAGQTITVKTRGGQSLVLDDKAGGSIELRGGGRILALRAGQVQIS
jgi:uncharacterized protein involved in type VI secretion and phage assembly